MQYYNNKIYLGEQTREGHLALQKPALDTIISTGNQNKKKIYQKLQKERNVTRWKHVLHHVACMFSSEKCMSSKTRYRTKRPLVFSVPR